LIVLPRELLAYWRGTDGPPVRRDFPFGPDYARACEASYPADLLKVGSGFGLVIGSQDHVGTANWLQLPERRGAALVGWNYADDVSMERVADLLRGDALPWRRFRRRMGLSNGDLILFHAASAGEEVRELDTFGEGYAVIGDGIPIRLGPGDYAIESVEVGGDLDRDSFGCVICRWVPLAGTA
jgi:hypothetical protein